MMKATTVRGELVALNGQDVVSLPRSSGRMTVMKGRAWVTSDGKDYVVSRGESVAFCGRNALPVISSANVRASLVVELSRC